MAENEILDVGNPRHYRRWRKALADANLSPTEVAECLSEDFQLVLRKKLWGKPLYLILKACGQDRKALLEAVADCKDRAMAKLVEQAHKITRSSDPLVVAGKIADLLIDSLVGRANRYAFKHDHTADSVRHSMLEQTASSSLKACKSEVINQLAASLRNEPIRRMPTVRKVRLSSEFSVNTSLIRLANKPSGEPSHV